MLLVLALDAAGYILAVNALPAQDSEFTVVLADIFVAVALLTITVGIVLPGMIAHSADEVSEAARRLAAGTVREFARAMEALGAGRLEAAHASVDISPVVVAVAGRTRRHGGQLQSAADPGQGSRYGARPCAGRAERRPRRTYAEQAVLARTVEDQQRLADELRTAKELAVHDSLHDGLTGLPNRTFLIKRLKRELSERRRDFAFFFIDLDRFKMVNDSLGHVAGDDLLVQVTGRLARRSRAAQPDTELADRHAGPPWR